MNTEEGYNVAARYRAVRKHLDSLGYKQALSLDALPLIEKLLADLIQTTESLKHFKGIAQQNIEACSQLQSTVDPYKCDNAKLVRECNQLHLDLIEVKEAHQKQLKDLKRQIYKLECECNDLQLASSRNLQKIKDLESESSRKSKKILELQGKCLKPTVNNVALASKKRACYPLRRPVLESEDFPQKKSAINSLPVLGIVEPKVLDLLSMADHKISCLNHEVTKLKGELSLQTDNVNTLRSQLTVKEKELLRLKKMLEGGRPYCAVLQDCSCKKMEKNMKMHDSFENNDIKMLQQAKLELEQQLKECLHKQHDAMTQALKLAERNEELEKELRDIDHIALAVEADCNSAVKENNRRVCRLQEKLEDVMTQVHALECELTVERREVQELRADLEACRHEKRDIQHTLDSTLDEKKQMTDRINELTVIEKSLNDEIDRLAKENENQRQDIIQLQCTNNMLKNQMHIQETLDSNDMQEIKEKGEKNDQNEASKNYVESGKKRVESEARDKPRQTSGNSVHVLYVDMQKQLNEKDIQIGNLQQGIRRLEVERDYYKDECNNLKDLYNRITEEDNADLWKRLYEFKNRLSEKDHIIDELQHEKRNLFREKTNLEARLQSYKGQQRKFCRSCNLDTYPGTCACTSSSPIPSGDFASAKKLLERLEHERDTARGDVQRLIEERDALRERLKMTTEAHTSEQRRLKENLADMEIRLKHIEQERQDLLLTQGTRRATINGLEDQLDDMREELKKTKQELAAQRTQYFQLRALQDQTDQALGDVQDQLTQSETELNRAMDRNRSLEQQQTQLDNQTKELKEEINNLHSSMAHLDQEKDQLLMVLDEKTEKIAALERELNLKEQQAIGTQQQIRDLQHKNK
ncbi:hypothetical protein KM043_016149 [Ampulex compressa]|nr:hypothetical protein KM043_016149 [Ampulex compressa]